MGNLLKLQFYRFFHDKPSIVQTIVILCIGVVIPVFACLMQLMISKMLTPEEAQQLTLVSVSGVLLMSFALYYFPMVLFYSMFNSFINKETTFGTRRNIIVSGYSKRQIFFSNTIFVAIVLTAIMLLYQLIGIIVTLAFNAPLGKGDISSFISVYLMNWLLLYVTVAFICTISMIVKTLGISNMIVIMVPVFLTILFMLLIQFLPFVTTLEYDAKIKPIFECIYWYQAYAFSFGSEFSMNVASGSTGSADPVILVNSGLYIKAIISSVILIVGQLYFGSLIFSKMDQK